MKEDLRDVLVKVAKAFEIENIRWGLGASGVLCHHNIVDIVNDIDIVVVPDDVNKAEAAILKMGQKVMTPPSTYYDNEYFGEFLVDGVELDMMSNMTIKNHGVTFLYEFIFESIDDYMVLEGVKIPVSALEEWYFLYHMIPNKDKKIAILDDYLKTHDFDYPEKLNRFKGIIKTFDMKMKE